LTSNSTLTLTHTLTVHIHKRKTGSDKLNKKRNQKDASYNTHGKDKGNSQERGRVLRVKDDLEVDNLQEYFGEEIDKSHIADRPNIWKAHVRPERNFAL
jgi:hypothetical protein